ncbi:ABC transporter substrate-binding protein [Paractinoplanes lichenicola]|uniref:Extracellular solute-binding protein n=1 Tax=Paractinoplanes lichenicola TaxID=2802976 RepID=A0ABS1VWF4_9ACTN|nr:extracellular solute-binding protein [Actinoplanes lichenicola]MBL7258817.1 extracellular solute-binding protein [Actinoplanes lichenicola]
MRFARAAMAASAAVALCLGLAACSGDDSGGDGPVKLVFRQFDPESEIGGLKTAVDAWNGSHPDIQVELQTLSPNNIQQFAREANSGSGPDINQVAFADVAFVANSKILQPLDEYLGAGKDDLLATDMVTFEDKTWAVPWTADTMALVYNKEKLGSNKPPTTWEELATTAASIKNGFCFPAAGSQTSAQWFAINYYLWSHGGAFIQNTNGAWSTGATKEQLTSALDFFNGLFTSGATSKSFQAVQDYSDPSIVNGLATGDCAMSYMPPATFATLTKQAGDKVTSAPMPSGLTDGATHLGGRALAVNRNSKHPDQAYEVIKYLTSAETFKTYSQYPASKKTLTELDVPEAQKGYVEQLPHSRSMARYIGSDLTVASIQQLVNQQFSAVYSGQSSSADAAQAILDGLAKGLKG